jgi:hypothetical protein
MKYTLAFLFCITISLTGFAQDSTKADAGYSENKPSDNDDKKSFHKENLFTGGSVILSLSSYGTVLGANPVFGYSITDWLDAGVAFNFSYYSSRFYDPYTGAYIGRIRQTTLGPGAFIKVYPIDYLFVQAQYEDNFTSQNQTDTYGNKSEISVSAPSFLTGIGYCGGREGTGSLFYYVAVLVDLGNNYYSPYLYHFSDGTTSIAPIFRAGLQIPLFQGKGHY